MHCHVATTPSSNSFDVPPTRALPTPASAWRQPHSPHASWTNWRPRVLLGCEDARTNACTKRLITAEAGLHLYRYFHQHLAPQLYGFPLIPERFPYAEDTESTITPYILAVILLVSAQRLPEYHDLVPILERELIDAYRITPHLDPEISQKEEEEERERLLQTDDFPPLNIE